PDGIPEKPPAEEARALGQLTRRGQVRLTVPPRAGFRRWARIDARGRLRNTPVTCINGFDDVPDFRPDRDGPGHGNLAESSVHRSQRPPRRWLAVAAR